MADAVANGLPFANDLSVALSSLPAADRASLTGLSVLSVRSWIAAKADEYHNYTLALHFMQNTLVPVHRLPVEMLSKIFIEAWQDRKSLRLTHVCRLWRSLLLDMPQFWAVAIAGDEFRLPSDDKDPSDEDYLVAACTRSATRDIAIRLSSISSRGHLQLIALADRITSLQLTSQGDDQLEWLWQVLHAGMPRLEELVIRLGVITQVGVHRRPLSTDKLPRLTRLTLPATLFPFSWRLTTIQEITLRSDDMDRYSHPPSKISLDRILEFLEYYPNLRALDLSDEAVIVSRDPRAVKIPTLERLRVTAHPETVFAILSCLTFPLSTNIDLGIVSDPPKWDDDDGDDWLSYPSNPWPQPDPFPDNSALLAVVKQIDHVTIENGPSPTVHGYIGGTERLKVRYIGGEWNRSRESELCLAKLFARTDAHVSHVRVITPPRFSQYSSLSDCPFSDKVLAAFPDLTHLTVRSPNATSFLISLSGNQHHPYHATPPHPPFLFLQDLTLGFETPRGHESLAPLRRHDITTNVADDFRQRCKLLAMCLPRRRLRRFEFFMYEEGCMPQDAYFVSHIDLAALDPELVEDGLRELKAFAGKPVVFSGYYFFTRTPEPFANRY